MKNKNIKLNCFCCGIELTAPQIYKGEIYGYTCIKKVSNQKPSKYKPYLIEVNLLESLETIKEKEYKIILYSDILKMKFIRYKRLTLGKNLYNENFYFSGGKYFIDLKTLKNSEKYINMIENEN